jgi:hypothetical protein
MIPLQQLTHSWAEVDHRSQSIPFTFIDLLLNTRPWMLRQYFQIYVEADVFNA